MSISRLTSISGLSEGTFVALPAGELAPPSTLWSTIFSEL